MTTNEDLTGMLVMVHPELPGDPAYKQGRFGIITHADLANDDIYVSFGKNETGLYGSDALLVMRNANYIRREALFYVQKLHTEDFKTLLQIALKMDGAGLKDRREAMQMAITNDTVRSHSTRTLDAEYGIRLDHFGEKPLFCYVTKR